MSFNLIESVKEVLSVDMTNKIAGILGESAVNVQQAMQGIIPTILTSVLLKTETGDVQGTLNLATDASRIDISYNLNSIAGGGGSSRGMDFLKILFGEKTTDLSELISAYSGVSSQSASSLMSIAAPAALGVLGKHILDTNMNASGLRSFLKGQKNKILHVMPTSLFLQGIMGLENLSDINGKFSGAEVIGKKSKTGSKWVLPLVICLIAFGVIWYILNMQKPSGIQPPPVADTVVTVKDTSAAGPVPVSAFSVKLPDGTQLNAKKGGIEDQLVSFFNDPDSKPSRRFPFNFDQLVFNNGTAVINNESMTQIQNVALILKAFPKARIKIGGFNDRGGDSVMKRTLTESRVASVGVAIKAAGAFPGQVISAEGFGSDFARYPADAPDSLREKDRRIAISIRAK
jgi:outer membrane protein OmpA-like peptidoglycan-associated protein